MNRRTFFGLAAGAAAQPRTTQAAEPPALMKVGCQSGPITDQRLEFFKRHSVNNICGLMPAPKGRVSFTADELKRLREQCERKGVSLDMITPPFLGPTQIDGAERPAILLGKSPERDRDIEEFQTLIRNCAAAGVPAIKYNLNIL